MKDDQDRINGTKTQANSPGLLAINVNILLKIEELMLYSTLQVSSRR